MLSPKNVCASGCMTKNIDGNCIVFVNYFSFQISCMLQQTSQLPLKNTIINSNYEQLKSYYYPPSSQRANEVVHDLPLSDDSISEIKIKSEMMESSASNYYSSHGNSDDDEYADYAAGTISPSHENFESEKIKIKPSDSKRISNTSEIINVTEMKSKPNITQLQESQQQQVPNNLDNSKFSKLLFSSPSATVVQTSNPCQIL